MSLPPLRLSDRFDSYISGEVIIHPSAVLAPGVILQAAPNSKIIIGSGVCIGMGAILNVHEGTLEVEAGANLGAGFLMVGKGKIGANACIGAATTVFNCSVEPGQVIAPGSILGETSQPKETATHTHGDMENKENVTESSPRPPIPTSSSYRPSAPQPASPSIPKITTTVEDPQPKTEEIRQAKSLSELSIQIQPESTAESPSVGTQIYGQGNIQRLLVTLFPHRQSLRQSESNGQSS